MLSMTIARTITMLALAREALEKFDNNVDAAISHVAR
jgi:hypothetical protein